jgi:hypothetical protein
MDLTEFEKTLDACAKAVAELPELDALRNQSLKLTDEEFKTFCEKIHGKYLFITTNRHVTPDALGFEAAVQVLLGCNEARQMGVIPGATPSQAGNHVRHIPLA